MCVVVGVVCVVVVARINGVTGRVSVVLVRVRICLISGVVVVNVGCRAVVDVVPWSSVLGLVAGCVV